MSTKNVTVYSKASCVQCTATMRHLDRRDIDYDVVDLDSDQSAYAMVRELGHMSAPVVITADGRHWSGFQPDELNKIPHAAAA